MHSFGSGYHLGDLKEEDQGDAMESKNEEGDSESQIGDFDSDFNESDQDGMPGGFKEEGIYFGCLTWVSQKARWTVEWNPQSKAKETGAKT